MIRIVVADDHDVVRSGLKSMFDESDVHVVAEATCGRSVFGLVQEHKPDLVLLDVRMPEGDGLQTLGRIRADFPTLPVLMFSSFDNPAYVARAAAMGASGYLLKSERREELLDAVRRAAAGETLWGREDLRKITLALAAVPSVDTEIMLTKRETEILLKVASGMTNREIAEVLDISYETVKDYVQQVLRKIGVGDRTQAAVWAVRRGII